MSCQLCRSCSDVSIGQSAGACVVSSSPVWWAYSSLHGVEWIGRGRSYRPWSSHELSPTLRSSSSRSTGSRSDDAYRLSEYADLVPSPAVLRQGLKEFFARKVLNPVNSKA